MDTRARGAEHGGEGGAVSRVQQRAVMVGRLPAQSGRTSCKHKQHKQQHHPDDDDDDDDGGSSGLYAAVLRLPEILRCPLSKMSNLSVARTSSPGRSRLKASVMTFRFLCRLYAFFEVKKVRLRFPRSWKTVPPPLRLRAREIPALHMAGRLHSVQGF